MPNEPTPDWLSYGKTAGGIITFCAAALGSIKFYFAGRNAGHLDRIIKLERREKEAIRVMQETVMQLQELAQVVDIDRGDSHRRFNKVEGDAREFRREVGQSLRRIADRIDQQLDQGGMSGGGMNDSSTRSSTPAVRQQPQPPTER